MDSQRIQEKVINPICYKESKLVMLGLFLISASSIMVEIALTKFLSYKVYYHYTYAVISLVIFAFGLAGAYIYIVSNDKDGNGKDFNWGKLSRFSCLYSITLVISIILFAWIPLDPYNLSLPKFLQLASLPVYFLILSIPFFFAGLCVSYTLCKSQNSVMKIYFWDLLGAAFGALICPFVLYTVGGYGLTFIAAVFGILASIFYSNIYYFTASKKRMLMLSVFIICSAALMVYPQWSMKQYGYDIRTTKDLILKNIFKNDFKGIKLTNWNVISRIDVSNTSNSESLCLRFGLSNNSLNQPIYGRIILVDGGANTRQFLVNGSIDKQSYLGEALWASPYIASPQPRKTLIIGGGGGIDILVAKYFKTPQVDVVEINPFTYGLLTGTVFDPETTNYLPWLKSDRKTKVKVYCKEARHFSKTCPELSYDIIQASGVDTLTAITTGGYSLVENYLYTTNAIKDYFRLLNNDGILSLTHWRLQPPHLALKIFLTYLNFLEGIGIKEPWKHVAVIAGSQWTDTLLKKSAFTNKELENLRNWSKKAGYDILFDPENKELIKGPFDFQEKTIYQRIAFAKKREKGEILAGYVFDVNPVSDDKPYFYHTKKNINFLPAFSALSIFENEEVLAIFNVCIFSALLLIFIPLLKYRRNNLSQDIFPKILFFSLCGFAFMLFEVTIIQKLTLFNGGPLYSFSVVLVGVLAGYAMGCFIAQFLNPSRLTFIFIGILLSVIFLGLYFLLQPLLDLLMPTNFVFHLLFSFLISFVLATFTGIPISLSMNMIRELQGNVIGWMWSINSAFNVIGGICFVPISQCLGISSNLIIVAICYFLANILILVSSDIYKIKERSAIFISAQKV